ACALEIPILQVEELLQAPTEGYGEAIVILNINADHFKIQTNLLQLVQANPYHGFERENPHTHINNFKRITSTLKFRDVPNDVIKLMMFPYSLEGTARVWYDKEPPNSILTLEDLVNKFVNQFFPSLKTTHVKNEITRFTQRLKETFGESNTIPNPKGEMKAITTRSGVSYEGPSIPSKPSSKKVVERETDETTDKEQRNFQGSTAHIQPPVIPILEPNIPKTLPKPNIPYPLGLNDQKLREKSTNQMEKFFQIFQDLHFDISFADALLLMPKFASTIKSLLANKDKLFELAKIPLNENFSAMLLKKLPKKLGDPRKFHIPCDFPGMDVCHALADLGRSFLRTDRALIDGYGEEITLRVNNKAVTFNLNQTTRYSFTYDDMSVNRIDVIDVAREEYAQEMLGFSNNSLGNNPTSTSKPIISDSSPSLTPFEGSDFILEEIEAYLKDESISAEIDHTDFKAKSLIKEPPKLELKDLPSHMEYAYLEGVDKLPMIIVQDLKVDEKKPS
nr:reverse transcriptase domain-containing protein [Tanacetum cinerariifolium]